MPSQRRQEEKAFQGTVVSALELYGYEGTHIFPLVDRSGNWRTPTTSPGWPDLVYLRPPRQLAIEVKLDGAPLPEHQRAWLSLFAGVPCCRAWVVRPSTPTWPTFCGWLRRPATAPNAYGFEPMDTELAHQVLLAARRGGSKAAKAAAKAPTLPGIGGRQPRRRS